MSERTVATGFIVHAFVQGVPGRSTSRLAYLGRLDDGRTFAAVYEPYQPFFFVRQTDSAAARDLASVAPEATDRTTMDGEPVHRVVAQSVSERRRLAERLASAGIRTYEADFNAADPRLMDAGVHGSVTLTGEAVPGRHVDLVFRDPEMAPSEWEPQLEVLSLDIETNPATDQVLAVGIVTNGSWKERASEIHLLGNDQDPDWITSYREESDLLRAVLARINDLDPDIITGWNVIDFDLELISRRLAHHHIPFAIARSDQAASFLESNRDDLGRRLNAGLSCQGRQVIDGLRLIRYGPQRFTDRKLDSVANIVLGEGKTIEAKTSTEKINTILSLYRDEPVKLSEYCRTDADLVLRILDRTGLLNLTLSRCRLIGISLNRAWTSIPAFEFLYTEALHAHGMVAPTAGIDRLPAGEAPGGAIITPRPGLFASVLVFDFKSLYPSIMRTFNIDPLGYRGSDDGYSDGEVPPPPAETITAPNGARFSREAGILPELLDRFWESRDEAKARDDQVASFVYKIIMNSFYGVLGSGGCRFSGAPLAGAITGFGQYILHWTRDRLAGRGYTVLYGDTDSLFVLAHPEGRQPGAGMAATPGGAEDAGGDAITLFALGETLCEEINAELAQFVRQHFSLESRLQLEFEKVYHRFYLPRIRHPGASAAESGEARGRAKGYAGRILDRTGGPGTLEIKGMEAIRSDWTVAAGNLQTALLELLFSDAGPDAVSDLIRKTLARLYEGQLDEQLVYSRRLRKPASSYTRTSPPHVQAARLLPPTEQEGMISYFVTTAGPQPVTNTSAPLDYAHYSHKQLRPIAAPICDILDLDTDDLFDLSGQLSLF